MFVHEPQFQYFNPFLEQIYYEKLENYVLAADFNWNWMGHTVSKDHDNHGEDTFVFGKLIYHQTQNEQVHEVWKPLIESIQRQFICNIHRIRLNLYTNQNKKLYTIPHHDVGERGITVPDRKFDIIILNFTTCNGGTKINNLEIMSKRNGAVFFNNVHKHCGFVQTDTQRRICANIVIYPKDKE